MLRPLRRGYGNRDCPAMHECEGRTAPSKTRGASDEPVPNASNMVISQSPTRSSATVRAGRYENPEQLSVAAHYFQANRRVVATAGHQGLRTLGEGAALEGASPIFEVSDSPVSCYREPITWFFVPRSQSARPGTQGRSGSDERGSVCLLPVRPICKQCPVLPAESARLVWARLLAAGIEADSLPARSD